MKSRRILFAVISTVLVLTLAGCILVACNDNKTFTVTFEGEGINTFKVDVQQNSAVLEPETPVRDGWLFGGWCDADGNIWDFDTPVTHDMTLHAEWGTKNLVLDAGEGKLNKSDKTEFYIKNRSDFILPVPTASSEALTFAGWEADGAMLTGADGKSVAAWSGTSLVTASAVWVTKGEKDVFRADTLSDGTYSISAWGEEYSSELTFPSEIGGKAVTEIGDMSKLSAGRVTVPASVKSIAARAFARNATVTIVDMSAFGGTIGDYAFNVSAVEFVDLGSTTAIGKFAFFGSNITMIYVPASVKSCAEGALSNEAFEEIDFEGDFPTLGNKVFGDGKSDLSIIASESAWNKLIEGTDDTKAFNVRVQDVTGLTECGIFTWSEEMIASGIASHGLYKGEGLEVYLGLGLNIAVIIDGHVTLSDVYDGKDVSDHFYNIDTSPKTTYYLDNDKKSINILSANENGEVIIDDVLYDYIGNDLVYTVPDDIKTIAGGAGSNNTSVRFVNTGKGVEKVGDFAFAFGNLFGVTIGEKVTEIGDFAFFYNSFLTQLLFEGTTAPTIGQGAFCDMLSGSVFVPMTLNNLVFYGGTAKIYTVDPVESFWGEAAGKPFFDAMVGSLEGLPLGTMKDSPDGEERPVSYSTSEFSTLQTSYFAAKGKTYESDYGTITMTGADTGYEYITFDEKSGYKGSGYIYFSAVSTPGYSFSYYDDTTAPLKIQIFTGIQDGEMQSITVFGILGDGKLALRGEEVGIYGDIDKEYFVIDGFGNVEYHTQSGEVKAGTYKAENWVLSVTGIEGITSIDVDTENHAITYNSQVLNALGDEAGIYYDLTNRAMLKLDGKPKDDASGSMTLVYNGKTQTMPYTIDGKKLKFKLNDIDKDWTFSKTASDVCTGYYDEDYNEYLKFNETDKGVNGTFNKGNSKLTLDGYFGATLDGKNYTYYYYEGGILLFDGDDVTIYSLDLTAHTFAEPTAPETGMYYLTASENYRLYLDGNGKFLYFNSGKYDFGTYELSEDGTLKTKIGEDKLETSVQGNLDTEKGYGMFVYNYYGDSFAGISKQPFEQLLSYKSIRVYGVSGDSVKSEGPSFSAYVSNNTLFITVSGKPISMYELSGQEQNLIYTFTSSDGWTADVDVKVTKKDSSYEVELSFKSGSSDHKKGTLDGSEKQFVFCWLDEDKTKVGVYEDDSWVSNFFCGTVKWTEDGKSFTVTDGETTYTVSGYDTDNVTVTKSEPAKSENA